MNDLLNLSSDRRSVASSTPLSVKTVWRGSIPKGRAARCSSRKSAHETSFQRHGLTLIELLVVVAILIILAGFIVPLAGNLIGDSKKTAANANLVLIRDAIMGTQEKPGFYTDTRQLTTTLKDLFINPFGPGGATPNPALVSYNRDTQLGWRGPYLLGNGGTYPQNFTPAYTAGDPTVLDPWGDPIILQIPNQTQYPTPTTAAAADLQFARLICAGADRIVDTPQNALDSFNNPYPPPSARGDDLVLFLNHSDSDP